MGKFNFKDIEMMKHQLLELYDTYCLEAETFTCMHYNSCKDSQKRQTKKQFRGGTCALMPYYNVSYNGVPIRIMIIGKENGYMKNKKFGTSDNFNDNCLNVLNCIGWERKNNHMKGTKKTLSYIFNMDSEYVMSAYCLSNLLRCSFQSVENYTHVSKVNDTKIMRDNCLEYLFKEIEIVKPTVIITQGEWAIKTRFIDALAKYFNTEKTCLKTNKNGKYGLYQFNNFMCITTHHPAIYGHWVKNLAPDSLWPMIDYLKDIGYIPTINKEDMHIFESHVKDTTDKILNTLPSNDRLRKSESI